MLFFNKDIIPLGQIYVDTGVFVVAYLEGPLLSMTSVVDL